MSTSLLIQPTGLSLVSLSRTHAVTAQTPLALASRFPKNAVPEVVISERSGNAWVWSTESSIVWEYDARGRRISEFSAGEKVQAICWVLAENGKDSVVVAANSEVRMMEKEGGKWDRVNTITITHPIFSMTASRDGSFLAMLHDGGELVVYDRRSEARRSVPLPASAKDVSPSLIKFAPSLPATLVLPFGATLLLVDAISHRVNELHPSGAAAKRILDISFSPVMEGTDAKKRGGLCGVLLEGGEVALIGLDQPDSAPKMLDVGRGATGITFIDGATIAAHTNTGELFLKDLRALGDAPVEVTVSQQVVGIHTLPLLPRSSSRASLAPTASAVSVKRTPFGEARNSENLPTPPPLPDLHKGKGKAREISRTVEMTQTEVVQTAEIHIPTSRTSDRRASHTGTTTKTKSARIIEPQEKARNVSAPIASSSSARPASRGRVSLPNPSGRAASESVASGSTSRAPRLSTVPHLTEAIIEEENEGDNTVRVEEESRADEGLDWALKSPVPRPTASNLVGGEKVTAEVDSEIIESLRRDMWGLQMEMLRMNRNLKSEIRSAVEPLKVELEQNRSVIEAQRREIERLRRGY